MVVYEAVAEGEMEAAAAGASSAVGLHQDLRLHPHLAVPWFVGPLLVLGIAAAPRAAATQKVEAETNSGASSPPVASVATRAANCSASPA